MNGRVHHFAARGLYNGLFLLGDRESGSYWDHITGECVHGPLRGYHLEIFPLLHTNVTQALASYSDPQIAISEQSFGQRLMAFFMQLGRKSKRDLLPPGFKKTMGKEDNRRPRMDIGLGVWGKRTHRFYPLDRLRAHDGALIDDFEGRGLLIYIDPRSSTPIALYTDANQSHWQNDRLWLDTGETVVGGKLSDKRGVPYVGNWPNQLFTRWYGFAYTFPGCEVYED